MRTGRLQLWAVLVLAAVGGCCGQAHDRDFVLFVPVVKGPAGQLRDSPKLWQDPNFAAGLPLVLAERGHEFRWARGEIRVRGILQGNLGLGPQEIASEERIYRAQLTEEALEAGQPVLPMLATLMGGFTGSGDFVPFVPVVRDVTTGSREDLTVWGDPNFVAGLPLVLMKYNCEFAWAPRIVRVRERMMYHPSDKSAEQVEFDETDLRANLTDKAIDMGERFLAAKANRQSP